MFIWFQSNLNYRKQLLLEKLCFSDKLVCFTWYINGCYIRNLTSFIGFCILFRCLNQLSLNQMRFSGNRSWLYRISSKWLQEPSEAFDTAVKGNLLKMTISAIVMDANAILNFRYIPFCSSYLVPGMLIHIEFSRVL